MTNYSDFISLCNPCSSDYHAWQDFKTLDTKHQIFVGAITGLVTLLTLPTFGLLGIASFRSLVTKFHAADLSKKNSNEKLQNEAARIQAVVTPNRKEINTNPNWNEILVDNFNDGMQMTRIRDNISKLKKCAFDRIFIYQTKLGKANKLWDPTDGDFNNNLFSKDEKSLLIFFPSDEDTREIFSRPETIRGIAGAQDEFKQFLHIPGNDVYALSEKEIRSLSSSLKNLIQTGFHKNKVDYLN